MLLAGARARSGEPNGEVWTSGRELQHRAHLGDAIEDLLTTPAGKVWAGGAELHAFLRSTWYRIDINSLSTAAAGLLPPADEA